MEALPKILIVDDDEQIRTQIKWALSDRFTVYSADRRQSAYEIFRLEDIPIILLDLGLPPNPREAHEGLALLEEIITSSPMAKVIIVSGNSERRNALEAIALGAHDFFSKPIDIEELKVVLSRVSRRLDLERESNENRDLQNKAFFSEIIGSSAPMAAVLSAVRKVAETDVPVLITGESGTGKELVANAIHSLSQRKSAPIVAINCGAIPGTLLESELFGYEKGSFTGATSQRRGRLEQAQGGTLFLDEIGDLEQELQVKLLRFLQEKVIERLGGRQSIVIDSRVIAATNCDLESAVKENHFREDLYFRLAVVKIELPPLRERGNDVVDLAEHLMRSFAEELQKPFKKFSQSALDVLRKHNWPGNVRELQNRVKRAIVLADGPIIVPKDLDLEALATDRTIQTIPTCTLKEAKEVLERELIANTLKEHGGNISKTSRALGISRPTMYDLIKRYGL
jgi:two-component system, NtrC family, response regulator